MGTSHSINADAKAVVTCPSYTPRGMLENPINTIINDRNKLTSTLSMFFHPDEKNKPPISDRTINIIEDLLIKGANPNSPIRWLSCDNNNNVVNTTCATSLHECCMWVHTKFGIKIAQLLLKYGAHTDPEFTSASIYSPLMQIIVHNHTKYAIDMIKILLHHGAHANITINNDTVFTLIEKYQPAQNKDKLYRILHSYCKKYNGHNTFERNYLNIVDDGRTPLTLNIVQIKNMYNSSTNFDEKIVDNLMYDIKQYLLAGANPNIMHMVYRPGKSTIYITSLSSCLSVNLKNTGVELTKLLLQAGASTELLAYNTGDEYEYSSPLMTAIRTYSGTHIIEIVGLLLDYGADVNYVSTKHNDVFMFINKYQTPENGEILRKMIADARISRNGNQCKACEAC